MKRAHVKATAAALLLHAGWAWAAPIELPRLEDFVDNFMLELPGAKDTGNVDGTWTGASYGKVVSNAEGFSALGGLLYNEWRNDQSGFVRAKWPVEPWPFEHGAGGDAGKEALRAERTFRVTKNRVSASATIPVDFGFTLTVPWSDPGWSAGCQPPDCFPFTRIGTGMASAVTLTASADDYSVVAVANEASIDALALANGEQDDVHHESRRERNDANDPALEVAVAEGVALASENGRPLNGAERVFEQLWGVDAAGYVTVGNGPRIDLFSSGFRNDGDGFELELNGMSLPLPLGFIAGEMPPLSATASADHLGVLALDFSGLAVGQSVDVTFTNDLFGYLQTRILAVPEPSALALLGLGLLAVSAGRSGWSCSVLGTAGRSGRWRHDREGPWT